MESYGHDPYGKGAELVLGISYHIYPVALALFGELLQLFLHQQCRYNIDNSNLALCVCNSVELKNIKLNPILVYFSAYY